MYESKVLDRCYIIFTVQLLIKDLRSTFPKAPIVFCNMPPIKEFPAFTPPIKFIIGNLVEILGKELALLIKNYENVYDQSDIIKVESWAKDIAHSTDIARLAYESWAKE